MYKPITVCIPAYNEGKTIVNTLNSIFNQNFSGKREIIICANACTDNTEKEVKKVMKKHSNVKLISIKTPGKANALNVLRKKASHNYIYCVDADVFVHPDAFRLMYEELVKSKVVAIAAANIARTDGRSLLTKIITPPSGKQGAIVGRLYCFDYKKLKKRFKKHGFTEMPSDLINEDAWLTLIVGKRNWKPLANAEVHYAPCGWSEYFRVEKRYVRGRIQLRKEYSHLLPEKESFSKRIIRGYKNLDNVFAFFKQLLGFVLRRYLSFRAYRSVKQEKLENALDGWVVSETSKVSLNLEKRK